MRRILLITALVSAAALGLGFSRVNSQKVDPSTPSRSLEFSYVVHVPALPSDSHQLRLWLPLPYEDAHQSVSDLKIESPVKYRIEREPLYGDRYAYMDVDAAKAHAPFDIRISFHLKRYEYRVSLEPSNHAPSAPNLELARYLQPDRLIPINGQIAELSNEQTGALTDPLQKARKIYDYVIATMHYDHDGVGWGHGDAIWACTAKHGNCTDFHSLFIGMARAAGIPARFQIGFPLPVDSHSGAITSYHCWAEFYAKGIGWIPIDASEAWKHKEKIDYFFGAVDTNRVMFTRGRDIRLKPPQNGDPLNYFVYPYAELDGKVFSDLKSDYSFRDDAAAEPAQADRGAN